MDEVINNYVNTMNQKLKKSVAGIQIPDEKPIHPEEEHVSTDESVPTAPGSPAYMPPSTDESVPWATGSPAYMPSNDWVKEENSSSGYDPNKEENISIEYNPNTSDENENDFGSVSLNDLFKTLPENRKLQVLSIENKEQQVDLLKNILSSMNVKEDKGATSILEVEEEKEIEEILEENNLDPNSSETNQKPSSSEIKTIKM
jgi:hypothetical protein